MSNRSFVSVIAMAAVMVVSLLTTGPAAGPTSLVSFVGVAASAQGFGEPRRSSIERSRAEASGGGAQALTAAEKTWTPPRTPDGQPDIQGFWVNKSGNNSYDVEDGFPEFQNARIPWRRVIVDPPDGKFPYQPWARAQRQEVYDHHADLTKWEYVDPHTRCFLSGVPRVFWQTEFQIVQPPGYVVILQEFNHGSRVIPLDGRPHVGKNIELWMGDSRGRWEGNTLVVEVSNNNDKTWFDLVGDFHSEALRIVERYTFVDPDTINYEATFEDPKVYTRPVKMALTFVPAVRGAEAKSYELLEHACLEGELDAPLMLKKLNSSPR